MFTLLGSLVLAAGALFGIWLGAYYSTGRLGAQLEEQARWLGQQREEEARRFDEQLQAESKRLERQLEHDRRMRDREELRRILDEVAGGVARAIEAVLQARNLVPVLGTREERYEESLAETKERHETAMKARKMIYELLFEIQRLRLRFGFGHPVLTTFMDARAGLVESLDSFDVKEDLWTSEQREVVEEKLKRSGRHNADFIEACRKYTDVEIA